MRTRNRRNVLSNLKYTTGTRTVLKTTRCVGTALAPGTIIGGPYPVDVDTNFISEVMVDDLGRSKSNPVLHRKLWYRQGREIGSQELTVGPQVNPGVSVGVDWYNTEHAMTWPASVWSATAGIRNWGYDSLVIKPPPPRWSFTPVQPQIEDSLKETCFEQAQQLKADVLLNAIEANQIYPALNSLARAAPTLAYNWREVRKFIKTASNAYLAWKFGVSPLLSDIMAIHRYLPKMGEDMKRHVEQKHSRFSAIAEVPMVFDSAAPDPSTYMGRIYSQQSFQGRAITPATVRYVLVVKPKPSRYLTPFFKGIEFAMGRFASSPAQLAWERIPFSFIADWLVDMRGVLRNADKIIGHEPFEIVSFTRSFSYKLQTSQYHYYGNPCDSFAADLYNSIIGQAEYSHYERTLASTMGSPIRWKPRLGKTQAAISAALIAQALSKLRSW